MSTNNYSQKSSLYAKQDVTGTGYLVYRDIIDFIPSNLKHHTILDIGCGAGRSTRWLKQYGLNVIGADISDDMLKHAKTLDMGGEYVLIKDNILPFENESFVLVTS